MWLSGAVWCAAAVAISATMAGTLQVAMLPGPKEGAGSVRAVSEVDRAAGLGALWLMPERFEARAGESVQVSLSRGSGAGSRRVGEDEFDFEWVFMRVRGVQENRDSLRGLAMRDGDALRAGEKGADTKKKDGVSVTLWGDGVAMIAADVKPRVEEMERGVLLDALRARVGDEAYQAVLEGTKAKERVRVRRVETAKCLIRVAKADGTEGESDAQNVITKAGQVNEIRFTMDPTTARIGSDVSLRVFADFDKSAGAHVIATCEEAGVTQVVKLDPSATGYLRLSHEGTWRVEFASVKVLKGDADADVAVNTATAVFTTKPKGANEEGER